MFHGKFTRLFVLVAIILPLASCSKNGSDSSEAEENRASHRLLHLSIESDNKEISDLSYQYDERGRQTLISDSNGQETLLAHYWDDRELVYQFFSESGVRKSSTKDVIDNKISTVSENIGGESRHYYYRYADELLDRVSILQNGLMNHYQVEYDNGQPSTLKGSNDVRVATYDDKGRLLTWLLYDIEGNEVSKYDASYHSGGAEKIQYDYTEVSYTYSHENRLLSRVVSQDGIIQEKSNFIYNDQSLLSKVEVDLQGNGIIDATYIPTYEASDQCLNQKDIHQNIDELISPKIEPVQNLIPICI